MFMWILLDLCGLRPVHYEFQESPLENKNTIRRKNVCKICRVTWKRLRGYPNRIAFNLTALEANASEEYDKNKE